MSATFTLNTDAHHVRPPAVFSFDTETFLIEPGLTAPPMVCLQFAWDNHRPDIVHAKDPAAYRIAREALESRAVINGHNLAYDMAVWCAQWPDLIPPIFRAYAEDRAICTAITAALVDIARGEYRGRGKGPGWSYSLADTFRRFVGGELDKTDPWRLRYGTLISVPVHAWPEDAVAYAAGDITAQQATFFALQQFPQLLDDQFRQARAGWWLHLMSTWGLRTDPEQVERFYHQTMVELERDREACMAAGLVRSNGVKNTKAAMARMVEVMEAEGLGDQIKITDSVLKPENIAQDKGQRPGESPGDMFRRLGKGISLDEDSCLECGDDLLLSYQRYGSANTIINRCKKLRHPIIQSRFDPLVETGRTSCKEGDGPQHGVQLHNLPRKSERTATAEEVARGVAKLSGGRHVVRTWGLRECFVPRPGRLYAGADFGGMELCSWAQVCLWSVGHSRLAQVLNAGEDPHADLGARLRNITPEQAKAILRGEFGKDEKQAFKDKERQTAKIGNFGYPGGMGPATLVKQARANYRVKMTLEESKTLRNTWRANWPESTDYFDFINGLCGNGNATIRHFLSNRVRANIPYTVTCNSFFQGLAADAAKAAGFRLAWECYVDESSPLFGCRIVLFVHDEFLLEVPAHPELAHLAAMRLQKVMVETAQEWMPDIRITADAALMTRYSKNAEPKYEHGMLVPWEEPVAA